ncbi:MAG TPA: hypothetical protein VIY69_12720, partial [Candidatus Acidoferrales bacterium]
RIESESQQMLVRNVEIVKSPNYGVMPSFVRLNVGDDTIEQAFAPGIYFNATKGSFHTFSSFPHGEFRLIGDFVGQNSRNGAVPSEIHGSAEIMKGIPDNQRKLREGLLEFRELMYKRLAAIWAMLDSHTVAVFVRQNSGIEVRDVFIGPFDFETGIPIECTHAGSILHSV